MTTSSDPIRSSMSEFDPRDAARALAEADQRTRRLNPDPPVLWWTRTVVFGVAYGGLWLSVRDQSPYVGPTGTGLAIAFGALLVLILVTAAVVQRALVGVTPATHARRWEAAAYAIVLASSFVFEGALHAIGAGAPTVYGVFAASGPLVAVGAMFAGYGAGRRQPAMVVPACVLVVVATAAVFTGPRTVWLVDGLGGTLLGLVVTTRRAIASRRAR